VGFALLLSSTKQRQRPFRPVHMTQLAKLIGGSTPFMSKRRPTLPIAPQRTTATNLPSGAAQ
jgi:hypothetical protein